MLPYSKKSNFHGVKVSTMYQNENYGIAELSTKYHGNKEKEATHHSWRSRKTQQKRWSLSKSFKDEGKIQGWRKVRGIKARINSINKALAYIHQIMYTLKLICYMSILSQFKNIPPPKGLRDIKAQHTVRKWQVVLHCLNIRTRRAIRCFPDKEGKNIISKDPDMTENMVLSQRFKHASGERQEMRREVKLGLDKAER